jgi:glycosyltransferase involved in cell wall biosynthesis
VFNSAPTLGELNQRVHAALRDRPAPWELILVNDGSRDASWDRIVALSEKHPQVRGLDLVRNFGQHNALLAGTHAARYEVIVTIDDDLQDRPEEIPRLLAALSPQVDLVYGKPQVKQRTLYRRLGTRAIRAMVALGVGRISLDIGGFRAFRASLLEGVDGAQGEHIALDTLLARSSKGHTAVTVQHDPRRHGSSNYTLGKLVGHALTELRSIVPDRLQRSPDAPSYVVRRTA